MPIQIPQWGKRYDVKCYRCGTIVLAKGKKVAGEAICQNCGASNHRPYERSRRMEVTVVVTLAFLGVWLISTLLRSV